MAEITDTYYSRGRQWFIDKDPNDDLYYARDLELDLIAANTTITSVIAIVVGVTLTEPAVIQGTKVIAKISGGNTSIDLNTVNALTFRITCANGEQFDRSINFGMVEN